MSDEVKAQRIEISPFMRSRMGDYKNKFILTLNFANKAIESSLRKRSELGWAYGSINRYHVSAILGYNIVLDTINTITVVYKLKDITKNDREVIYNVAYLSVKPKEKNLLHVEMLDRQYKDVFDVVENLMYQAICPSGSMVSKDGEYRSGLLSWNMIQLCFKKNPDVEELFNYLLKYFRETLRERKYILLLEYYFPTDKLKNNYSYEAELMCSTKKIHFYCITWFKFYFSYINGFISNHINDTFKKLMLQYSKPDTEFFQSIFKKFPIDTIIKLRYIFSENIRSPNISKNLYIKMKLGQKIVPLNLLEAQHPFSIEFGPWKELLIMLKVSDIVINNISNGFALCNSWLYIKNATKGLFDNPSQSERIEKSAVAIQIAEILRNAKHLTKANVNANVVGLDSEDISNSGDHETITSWLSSEFNVLHNKIKNSIRHAKENIIMSNVSLCIVSEYLGKTLYDAVFFTKKSKLYNKYVGHILSKENYPYFTKYMFQLCYNVLCLNIKLGVIHGDLHLNNITLNPIIYKKAIKIDVASPKIMYRLNSNFTYIFEHNFYDLCIIDYSRSILDIEGYERLKDAKLSTVYDIVHKKKEFVDKQIDALLSYLLASKPELRDSEVQIHNMFQYHYKSFFKVLTVLDLYSVTNKLIDFMKVCKDKLYKPCAETVRLVTSLNKSAEYYLNIVLMRLIEKKNYIEIDEMEWPMLTIIKDNFDGNLADLFEQKDFDTVVDVYNIENPSTFSLSEYNRFPPILKDKSMSDTVDTSSEADTKFRNFLIKRRRLYEAQYIKNFSIISYIAKRQKEKNV